MIYVFTDSSGYQSHKEPDPSEEVSYLFIDGNDEQRILDGEPWVLNEAKTAVVFRNPAEVATEKAAADLAAERAAMIVSRFQARAALLGAGLLETTDTAMQGADEVAKLAWSDAQEFRRNSPLVAAIAAQLGLADTQLDDLFRQAATIEA